MPPIAFGLISIHLVGILVVTVLRTSQIRQDPTSMPGGGWPAVAVVAILWPLLLAIVLVAMAIGIVSMVLDRLGL